MRRGRPAQRRAAGPGARGRGRHRGPQRHRPVPRAGRPRASLHDVNVIGTLQLLTVCDGLAALRAIVVRGSAAIYGSEPAAPAFFTEDDADRFPLRTRFQRDIGELERLLGAFARRHPASCARCCGCSRSSGATSTRRSTASCARPWSPPCSATTRACRSSTPTTPSALCARPCCTRCAVRSTSPLTASSRSARAAPRAAPGAADRRARCGARSSDRPPRRGAAGTARRDRALPALRARRRHHPHAQRAGLPARALTLEALSRAATEPP